MLFSIHTFESLESTSSTARQWIDGGAEAGTVIRAVRQTAGRGRQGRSWTSLPGSLLFSVILRPAGPAPLLPRLGFFACVAAAHAAERCGLSTAWLKWPNDLVLPAPRPGESRNTPPRPPASWVKWGGVLVETGVDRGGRLWAVMGVGLNIGDPGGAGAELAALNGGSLSDALDQAIDPSWFLELFLAELGSFLDGPPAPSWERALAAWRARDVLSGRSVGVEVSGHTIEGAAAGIDERGALGIRTSSGVVWIDAGEVHLSV